VYWGITYKMGQESPGAALNGFMLFVAIAKWICWIAIPPLLN